MGIILAVGDDAGESVSENTVKLEHRINLSFSLIHIVISGNIGMFLSESRYLLALGHLKILNRFQKCYILCNFF